MAMGENKDRVGQAIRTHTIVDGRDTVAGLGTAEAMSATDLYVDYIIITAETNNTGVITVGGSTVVAAENTRRGIPLNAGDTVSLGAVNLKDVYLDTTVNGDEVTYLYLQ